MLLVLGVNQGGGWGVGQGRRPDPFGFRPFRPGLGGGVGVKRNSEHNLVHSHLPSHQIRSNAAYNAADTYATIWTRGNQDDEFTKS